MYLALKLSQYKWKLVFSTGLEQTPQVRNIVGGNLGRLEQEFVKDKQKFEISEQGSIIRCYEAGRDGFWLHRYLCYHEIENWNVDSTSIEINRRVRRTKTNQLDVRKLLIMLIRFDLGEENVWHTVNVPTVSEED